MEAARRELHRVAAVATADVEHLRTRCEVHRVDHELGFGLRRLRRQERQRAQVVLVEQVDEPRLGTRDACPRAAVSRPSRPAAPSSAVAVPAAPSKAWVVGPAPRHARWQVDRSGLGLPGGGAGGTVCARAGTLTSAGAGLSSTGAESSMSTSISPDCSARSASSLDIDLGHRHRLVRRLRRDHLDVDGLELLGARTIRPTCGRLRRDRRWHGLPGRSARTERRRLRGGLGRSRLRLRAQHRRLRANLLEIVLGQRDGLEPRGRGCLGVDATGAPATRRGLLDRRSPARYRPHRS